MQIKGSKSVAHSQEDDLETSMKECLKQFRQTFSGLDWPYMMERRNGELFCDVGVTVQPVHDEALVGLWRLDCLEASFGAGGYNFGNIHTLNTMSMFGGLQAEMASSRRRRTHISFCSAYNLVYEAVRKQDNSRSLFEEKKVFGRYPEFHSDMASVQRIFQEIGPRRSYGVRLEFRVGGGALEKIIESIDDVVSLEPTIRSL